MIHFSLDDLTATLVDSKETVRLASDKEDIRLFLGMRAAVDLFVALNDCLLRLEPDTSGFNPRAMDAWKLVQRMQTDALLATLKIPTAEKT